MPTLFNLPQPKLPRPPLMLNDMLVTGLCWADLEEAWREIASPDNAPHVQDFVTAIWKESAFLPEAHTLQRILAATVLLAGPACFPGPGEGPITPS